MLDFTADPLPIEPPGLRCKNCEAQVFARADRSSATRHVKHLGAFGYRVEPIKDKLIRSRFCYACRKKEEGLL